MSKIQIFLLLFLCCIGLQVGILVYEGNSVPVAVYGAVATMTTVGFGDISPQTTLGRLLYIPAMIGSVLLVPTITVIFYDTWSKNMKGLGEVNTKNHVVVMGDSHEIIESAVADLAHTKVVVLSDTYETSPFKNASFIKGNVTDKEALRRANVKECSHVIICSNSDAKTLLATALVRELSKDCRISATIISGDMCGPMKVAGANSIIHTDIVSGRMLASTVFEPVVVNFLEDVMTATSGHDLVQMFPNEAQYGQKARAVLGEAFNDNHRVIGLIREGKYHLFPDDSMTVMKGDQFLVLA